MNTLARFVNYFFIISPVYIYAVPPEPCFAKFRWDDCGKPPVPVMYYWQPGSRCEVGMWRGCLPNINMFPDEYTCINTCIFGKRTGPNDYEELKAPDINEEEEIGTGTNDTEITIVGNTTGLDTENSNSTDITNSDDGTTEAAGNDLAAGNATAEASDDANKAEEGGDETTAAPDENNEEEAAER